MLSVDNHVSLNLKQLNVEDQRTVCRDAGHATRAIGQVRRHGQATLTANGHAGNTNLPALDDLALPDLEGEGFTLLIG